METVQAQLGQKIFSAPSVFNFFQPDYQPIGPVEAADKVAPEFQITNAQTIAGYMNLVNRWLIYDEMVDDWGRGYEEPYDDNDYPRLDLGDEMALTELEDLPELIDRLDVILTHGTLSERTKNEILAMLRDMPTDSYSEQDRIWQRNLRARVAIYLILVSPEYLINR